MMDISKLGVVSAAEKGAEMPLLNPFTGEETGAVFTVLGYDAEAVIAAARSFDKAEAKSTKTEPDDILRRRKARLAVAAVTGWSNFVFGGHEMPYSADKATEIFSQPDFAWIVDQVQRFGGDRGNFFPQGSGS